MRFVAVSDLHGELPEIDTSRADAIILAGDLCPDMPAIRQLGWLEGVFIPYIQKFGLPGIAILGNHDFVGIHYPPQVRQAFAKIGIEYLEGQETTFNGLSVFGSPYVTNLPNWAFNMAEDRYKDFLQYVDRVDLMITHGPPQGVLDGVPYSRAHTEHVGSPALRDWVFNKKPKAHVFGHIHEAFGQAKFTHLDGSATTCYNVSQYGGHEGFRPRPNPVYFEL